MNCYVYVIVRQCIYYYYYYFIIFLVKKNKIYFYYYKITPRINTGRSYEDWILFNMAVATQRTRHVFKRPYSSQRMTVIIIIIIIIIF